MSSSADYNMNSYTSPVARHGQITPPQSIKPTLQSHTPNNGSVHGFSHIPRSASMNPSQAQMTVYYDGPQTMSPPPMVSSPYPTPSRTNTETRDPRWEEFLEYKRKMCLEEQRQQQQQHMRVQSPQQPYAQQQHEGSQERYSPQQQRQRSYQAPQQQGQPKHEQESDHPYPQYQEPQEQHKSPEQPQPQPQPRFKQEHNDEPDQILPHHQTNQWQREQQHPHQEPQDRNNQQQHPHQQQRYKQEHEPEYHRSPTQSPIPLPAHLQMMRQIPQGRDLSYVHSAPTSRTTSIDDYDRSFPGHFMPPQPIYYPVRQGHTFGKVIVKGNAKVLMGNGISSRPTGLERQHTYSDVEIEDEGNLRMGDMSEDRIAAFFARPPRDTDVYGAKKSK